MSTRGTLLVGMFLALGSAEASAQHLFVGLGGGASEIDPQSGFPAAATRPSVTLRAGVGGRRFNLVLDWQRHGLNDEQPLPTDYQNGITARVPRVVRTEFLLLGAQLHLTPGFYIRPSAGISRNAFPVYYVPNGTDAETAEISHEGGLAFGLGAGYQLKVSRGFSLAIEGSVLQSGSEDSTDGRTVLGIQVVPMVRF